MSCTCAERCDEYNGWRCTITGGECVFWYPSSKLCAEIWGEGPDSEVIDDSDKGNDTA